MSKVFIGMPTPEVVSVNFVDSLLGVVSEAKADGHYVETMFMQGVRTDKNRNEMVKYFLDNNFDYLLFLDTDMTYPKDIVRKYIGSGKELIGGVYYKRSYPHFPVVFALRENGHFQSVDPTVWGKNQIIKVDGLGTGGMMITRSVFDKITASGQDYWFNYGLNYHIPGAKTDIATHDLVFCKKFLDAGGEVFVHTGVQMNHVAVEIVTEQTWVDDKKKIADQSVLITIPISDADEVNKLEDTLKSIEDFTKYEDYVVKVLIDGNEAIVEATKDWKFKNTIIEAFNNTFGDAARINAAVGNAEENLFVYLKPGAIVGDQWLDQAIGSFNQAFPDKDGLIALNDGHSKGKLAKFGLVHRNFIMRHVDGRLFYPYFKTNHEKELTQIAAKRGRLAYAYDAVAMYSPAPIESAQDDSIFNKREELGFPLFNHF
jgi:hypothetical protein